MNIEQMLEKVGESCENEDIYGAIVLTLATVFKELKSATSLGVSITLGQVLADILGAAGAHDDFLEEFASRMIDRAKRTRMEVKGR